MHVNGVLLLLASYLLGAVPFGWIAARCKGVDLRAVGSGNIGATNVFRSVSKPLGLFVFFCDAAKGFIPVFFFPHLDPALDPEAWRLAFGCAAIAGHNWPVFLRFKGGKGVATSAGVLLGLAPPLAGAGLLIWIVLLFATGYVAVASLGAALAIAILSWFHHEGILLPAAFTALSLLVAWTHRTNLQRLKNGTEHRFAFGRKIEPPRSPGNTEE